jgi:hypothetical protein
MPICVKCKTGFDSNLSHCPNCGTIQNQNSQSYLFNRRTIWERMGIYSLVLSAIALLIGSIFSLLWGWYLIATGKQTPGLLVIFVLTPFLYAQFTVFWYVFRQISSR